jgi:hypothetical protein
MSKRRAEGPSESLELRSSACTSVCPTQDHASWGACVRAKGLQVSPAVNEQYGTRQRALDSDLNHYESAVRQGLSPTGTSRHKVDAAIKEADAT